MKKRQERLLFVVLLIIILFVLGLAFYLFTHKPEVQLSPGDWGEESDSAWNAVYNFDYLDPMWRIYKSEGNKDNNPYINSGNLIIASSGIDPYLLFKYELNQFLYEFSMTNGISLDVKMSVMPSADVNTLYIWAGNYWTGLIFNIDGSVQLPESSERYYPEGGTSIQHIYRIIAKDKKINLYVDMIPVVRLTAEAIYSETNQNLIEFGDVDSGIGAGTFVYDYLKWCAVGGNIYAGIHTCVGDPIIPEYCMTFKDSEGKEYTGLVSGDPSDPNRGPDPYSPYYPACKSGCQLGPNCNDNSKASCESDCKCHPFDLNIAYNDKCYTVTEPFICTPNENNPDQEFVNLLVLNGIPSDSATCSPTPIVSLQSSMILDTTPVEKLSNGIISTTDYEEKTIIDNVEYNIATEKDKLYCNFNAKFTNKIDKIPEDYVIKGDVNGKTFSIDMQECELMQDINTVECKFDVEYSVKSSDIGKSLICNGQIFSKKTNEFIGNKAESNKYAIAKYIYYFAFVDLEVEDYDEYSIFLSHINAQWEDYVKTSQINKKLETVGKKILLKDIKIGNLEDKGLCRLPNTISFIKNFINTYNPFSKGFFLNIILNGHNENQLVNKILSKINKAYIPGSKIIIYVPEKKIEAVGCALFNENWVLISQTADNSNVLTHELGHSVGRLCDEYKKSLYELQGGLVKNNCPNPVGEDKKIHFPDCCVEKSRCSKNGGICIAPEKSQGLKELNYDCSPLPNLKCYKPECEENKDCKNKGCYCNTLYGKCVSCNADEVCVTEEDVEPSCEFKDTKKQKAFKCENIDTSCNQLGSRCLDCTSRGLKCLEIMRNKGYAYFKCAISSEEYQTLWKGSCGNYELCQGMPFADELGNIPKDINVPSEINYHSVMGISSIPTSVYPDNAKCPLKNC